MRAYSYDQLVATLPDCIADIKDRGGETWKMLADLDAVQPDRRPELRLADAQYGDMPQRGHIECPLVPKPIAALTLDAGIRNERAPGQLSISHSILDQHPAIE